MHHWSQDAIFYHIFPLGAFGAEKVNDFSSPPTARLLELIDWVDYLSDAGFNAVCLGPVFESSKHGYDTANYFQVDRRLGTNEDLKRVCAALKARGLRVVFDAVLNHVGRDFPQFQKVRHDGTASDATQWFHVSFDLQSPFGEPFNYQCWNGCYDLVKLNTGNEDVRNHLFHAARFWIEEFGIDGLRLDAADVLDIDFQRRFAQHCRSIKPDIWLMGEVIHGDYRRWANSDILDSTTNYEAFKGLYSSHNDKNYFEIAHSLSRQFGEYGLYKGMTLFNFVDNHDVDRIANQLRDPAHLYPLHILLFTIPGVPSIYYGSEWGIDGRKTNGSDDNLRPYVTPALLPTLAKHADLQPAIKRLIDVRKNHPSLRYGSFNQIHVGSQEFVFERRCENERALVMVNSSPQPKSLTFTAAGNERRFRDVLNHGHTFELSNGKLSADIPAHWGRVLIAE